MEIIIIAALAENRVIGQSGGIPWHIREDFQRFKALTLGKPCIMGRKTWESLPRRPLPDRPNLVISRDQDYQAPGALVFASLDQALEDCGLVPQVFICGGASLYAQALPLAQRLELTWVAGTPEGDTYFPPFSQSLWHLEQEEPREGYRFCTYRRNPGP